MLMTMLRLDFQQLTKKSPSRLRIMKLFITSDGFRAVCLYRIGNWLLRHNFGTISKIFSRMIFHGSQCSISLTAEIGPGFCIQHCGDIVIGGSTIIGKNCDIRQGVTFGGNVGKSKNSQMQPIVGDNVLIGAGAKILGPIIIGSNSVVGANAVVITDIPPNSVAAGIPARVISKDGKRVDNPKDQKINEKIQELTRRLELVESQLQKREIHVNS